MSLLQRIQFYCRKICGDPDFSIKDWEETRRKLLAANVPEEIMKEILHPELKPCEKQCFTCMADVGERQLKTKNL